MLKSLIKDKKYFYKKNGYLIVRNLLNKNDVKKLRKKILKYFADLPENKKDLVTLPAGDIVKNFPEIFEIQNKQVLIDTLRILFSKSVNYINTFQIQKNCSSLNYRSGWHIDAGSQEKYEKLNKDLEDHSSYQLGKIGIYLQDKSPFGQSISVVPGLHRNAFFRKVLFRLLKNKIFSKLTHKIFVRDLQKELNSGDAVIFDCRLPHRSSVTSKVINRNFDADLSLDENSKLVIYFEAGKRSSCETYLRNSLTRMIQEEVFEGRKGDLFFADYLRFGEEDIANILSKNKIKKSKNHIPFTHLDKRTRDLISLIYEEMISSLIK